VANVQVTVHDDAIDRLMRSGQVRDMLHDAVDPIVDTARSRAPKDSGAGSRSIHSEMVLHSDEWEALVSWDQHHWYMYFSEKGTRYMPARPFLVPALRAAAR
jgi:HK97 gp10 family phage protein